MFGISIHAWQLGKCETSAPHFSLFLNILIFKFIYFKDSDYTLGSEDNDSDADSDEYENISDNEIGDLRDDLLEECYTLGCEFRTSD